MHTYLYCISFLLLLSGIPQICGADASGAYPFLLLSAPILVHAGLVAKDKVGIWVWANCLRE